MAEPFLSPEANLALNLLLGRRAEELIRTPNPDHLRFNLDALTAALDHAEDVLREARNVRAEGCRRLGHLAATTQVDA